MTTLTRAVNLPEALRLKARLEAAGIACRIPDEAIVRAYRGAVIVTGGLRVEVADASVGRAREILEDFYYNAHAASEEAHRSLSCV